MQPFRYVRAADAARAVGLVAADPGAGFIAGGTDRLNLMKDRVEAPSLLVDVNAAGPRGVAAIEGGVLVGAAARMADVADDPQVRAAFPVLSQALLASASPQVRNMASVGGNLLQRTRCWYFRDASLPCNTRSPGSGCPALAGENRIHAVLGGSDACIKVHPSDMAVALLALDAVVLTEGPAGARRLALDDFYVLPGATPERETVLEHGELIVGVELKATRAAARSRYVKVRDRASFEFALVSVAVALDVEGGVVRDARVALGGVAPRPWRARGAEDALRGRSLGADVIAAAGEAAVAGAAPREGNRFKVELAKRAVARALNEVGGLS
ncbi:MAG TPA: xanthine dehydrogenase family protein subunit M [Polyangiaceae bacterium]|nr:xanthine dehydrogenase family protein subunit M [Polyangiaceae bacterium]